MSEDTQKGLFQPPQRTKVFRNPRPIQQERKARTRKTILVKEEQVREHLNKLNRHNESCKNQLISAQGHY